MRDSLQRSGVPASAVLWSPLCAGFVAADAASPAASYPRVRADAAKAQLLEDLVALVDGGRHVAEASLPRRLGQRVVVYMVLVEQLVDEVAQDGVFYDLIHEGGLRPRMIDIHLRRESTSLSQPPPDFTHESAKSDQRRHKNTRPQEHKNTNLDHYEVLLPRHAPQGPPRVVLRPRRGVRRHVKVGHGVQHPIRHASEGLAEVLRRRFPSEDAVEHDAAGLVPLHEPGQAGAAQTRVVAAGAQVEEQGVAFLAQALEVPAGEQPVLRGSPRVVSGTQVRRLVEARELRVSQSRNFTAVATAKATTDMSV
eukprot:scaffold320_cov367-Pinguiococcus_pyrenoidosus.AAC.15